MIPPIHKIFWKKHTASVPKGYLRYRVLKLLSQQSLSGSEIMDILEKEADGCWRPSPGSIYPLLSLFQDKGYVTELPKDETGRKKYKITEAGKKALEEHEKSSEKAATPLFLGPFFFNKPFIGESQLAETLKKTVKKLFSSMFKLRKLIYSNPTKKVLSETKQLLEKLTDKLEEEIDNLERKAKEED